MLCLLDCCWVGATFPAHATSNEKANLGQLLFVGFVFSGFAFVVINNTSKKDIPDTIWMFDGETERKKTTSFELVFRVKKHYNLICASLGEGAALSEGLTTFCFQLFSSSFVEAHRRCMFGCGHAHPKAIKACAMPGCIQMPLSSWWVVLLS